jgi:hypothetical protein
LNGSDTVKALTPRKSAHPTASSVRPFFQTKREQAAHDTPEIVTERPGFFRASAMSADAGVPLLQAKSAKYETETPEGQVDQNGSKSSEVQRTPAFESSDESGAENNVQRQLAFSSDRARFGSGASPFFPAVQARLTVGHPSDRYEREADAVADRVVNGRAVPAISSLPPGGLRRNTQDDSSASVQSGQAANAIDSKGGGEPLQPTLQRQLSAGLDHDLSAVRVHSDAAAQDSARSLNSRAFTHGNDIWLGPGESQQDTRLMAHEATHVVQQTGPSNTVQRAPAAQAGAQADLAPGIIELKDQSEFKPSDTMADWLEQRKKKRGPVKMRFGTLAEGKVEVRKSKDQYEIKQQAIPLSHPFFQRTGEELPANLMPSLIVSKSRKGQVKGYISLKASAGLSANKGFNTVVKQGPAVLGMAGFDLSKLSKVTNKLEAGKLHLGMSGVSFRLGGAFAGTFNLTLINEAVTFDGSADVSVQGLATGTLTLIRDEKGLITGTVNVSLNLPKNFSGGVDVAWDGRAVTGEGKVGYQGEKLSGEVMLKLMEKSKALELENAKKAPPEEGETAGKPAAKKTAKKKPGKVDYVVFGEGDLTFAFTDWLNGTAHVIVDPKGFVTIIGKITPQKEFELFAQRDYVKALPKLEARAAYGIPVVGNLFIFANIGLSAFAKLGPAKFYKIEVAGTYSTDPDKNKDFSIKGSLNVSAAAGVKLRGEVGAGIEILDHDLKAGGGVDATAGIKGYAEATPVIGYREKGTPGEDKKGEFFIRGDLEIAAQPFFALGGDLFVEVDSPWWSPLPDKRWTWPLGSKEWPLGGSFGFGASVDYVFGSGKPPEITFPPVKFSAEKFTSDMINDKTKPKAGAKEPQEGKWKEKNTKAAEPPSKEGGPGAGVSLGKGKAPAPGKPSISKEKKKPATPGARTADGKTVKELKDAARKGKKVRADDPKDAKTSEPTAKSKKAAAKTGLGSAAIKAQVRGELASKIGKKVKDPKLVKKSIDEIYKRYRPKGLKFIDVVRDKKHPGKFAIAVSASEKTVEISNIEVSVEDTRAKWRDLNKTMFNFVSDTNLYASLSYVHDREIIKEKVKPFPITNSKNKHAEEVFVDVHLPKIANEARKRKEDTGVKTDANLTLNRLTCGEGSPFPKSTCGTKDCTGLVASAQTAHRDYLQFHLNVVGEYKKSTENKEEAYKRTKRHLKKLLKAGVKVSATKFWREIVPQACGVDAIAKGFITERQAKVEQKLSVLIAEVKKEVSIENELEGL